MFNAYSDTRCKIHSTSCCKQLGCRGERWAQSLVLLETRKVAYEILRSSLGVNIKP
jgi:hypothetical protein